MTETQPAGTLRLERMEGPEIEPIVLSGDDPIVFGRSHQSAVTLADPSVSRRHASLERRGDEWFVTDLESRHGTFLNTVRLSANTPTRVRHQDFLTIGPWAFFVLHGGAGAGADSGYRSAGATEIGAVPEAERETITLRLGDDGSVTRELGRAEFERQYEPVLVGFALNAGASHDEAREVASDVTASFFGGGGAHGFDPAKGHFRTFLRWAALKALRARFGRGEGAAIDVDRLEKDTEATNAMWNWHWAKSLLQRAADEVRPHVDDTSWEAFHRFGRQGEEAESVADDLGRTFEEMEETTERVSLALREIVERIRGEEG